VQCWGYNFYGELGDGTMINRNRPAPVMGLSTVQQLAAGTNHNCARLANSEVHCWGRNTESQLGDGFRTNRSIPFPVQAATATPAMAVSQTGFTDVQCDTLRCWGRTMAGTVLGWGYIFPSRATVVAAFATVTQNTRAWAFGDTQDPECDLRTDMMTWCRGRNEFGQVGIGMASLVETTHRSISSAFSVLRMSRGYGAPCAVERTTGRVLCWGWTGDGGLLATGATGLTMRPFEVLMP
jgi:alpha-tubulin suppressor-like RCC1 family protein